MNSLTSSSTSSIALPPTNAIQFNNDSSPCHLADSGSHTTKPDLSSSCSIIIADSFINQGNDTDVELPPPVPPSKPVFMWGTHSGEEFSSILKAIYSEVVHWRRNCFTVPLGKAGREFVSELSRLYLAFATASSLESIALKAAVVLPILLLQKPQRASKLKDHVECLERRLKSWKEGNLNDLLMEGRAIQCRLPKSFPQRAEEKLARTFSNLMFAGKCKAALDLLS